MRERPASEGQGRVWRSLRSATAGTTKVGGERKVKEGMEMNRLKAVYRGWGIPCAGTKVYAARYREEWLKKIPQAGVCRRAELLYQQLDELQALRRKVRAVLSREPKT